MQRNARLVTQGLNAALYAAVGAHDLDDPAVREELDQARQMAARLGAIIDRALARPFYPEAFAASQRRSR